MSQSKENICEDAPKPKSKFLFFFSLNKFIKLRSIVIFPYANEKKKVSF